jgi:hypothetical protein
MYIYRDCATGVMTIKTLGDQRVKTYGHRGTIFSEDGNVTLVSKLGLESTDTVSVIASDEIKYKFSTKKNDTDGLTFTQTSFQGRTCVDLSGVSQMFVRFGPNQTEKIFYSGDSINLKTMGECF